MPPRRCGASLLGVDRHGGERASCQLVGTRTREVAAFDAISMARARACRLLRSLVMAALERSLHSFGALLGRMVHRGVAMAVGFVLTIIGLGMTATIVMLPVGVVLLLLGVAIVVGAIFAPDRRDFERGR